MEGSDSLTPEQQTRLEEYQFQQMLVRARQKAWPVSAASSSHIEWDREDGRRRERTGRLPRSPRPTIAPKRSLARTRARPHSLDTALGNEPMWALYKKLERVAIYGAVWFLALASAFAFGRILFNAVR